MSGRGEAGYKRNSIFFNNLSILLIISLILTVTWSLKLFQQQVYHESVSFNIESSKSLNDFVQCREVGKTPSCYVRFENSVIEELINCHTTPLQRVLKVKQCLQKVQLGPSQELLMWEIQSCFKQGANNSTNKSQYPFASAAYNKVPAVSRSALNTMWYFISFLTNIDGIFIVSLIIGFIVTVLKSDFLPSKLTAEPTLKQETLSNQPKKVVIQTSEERFDLNLTGDQLKWKEHFAKSQTPTAVHDWSREDTRDYDVYTKNSSTNASNATTNTTSTTNSTGTVIKVTESPSKWMWRQQTRELVSKESLQTKDKEISVSIENTKPYTTARCDINIHDPNKPVPSVLNHPKFDRNGKPLKRVFIPGRGWVSSKMLEKERLELMQYLNENVNLVT